MASLKANPARGGGGTNFGGGGGDQSHISIKKKPRFFDGYVDIVNTKRTTLKLSSHDQECDFEWRRNREHPEDPLIIYDPKSFEQYGIAINSRLISINTVDSSVLPEGQIRTLLNARPLTLRFATRKRKADGSGYVDTVSHSSVSGLERNLSTAS